MTMEGQLTTPVVLLMFNRPNTTKMVFERIRQVRPSKLFVIADGSRPDRASDPENVAKARIIAEGVDWPCDLHRVYSDTNLGCRSRVSTGISEVFRHVDRAIILEDDCLPSFSFFSFATEMLKRFEEEHNVLSVRGDNYQRGRKFGAGSYYFSKYGTCWGWATWKRSWDKFDVDMKEWPMHKSVGLIERACPLGVEREFWHRIFEETYMGKINSWAYPWVFHSFMNSGLHVAPQLNLVQNIGFSCDATNTKGAPPRWVPRKSLELKSSQVPVSIEECVEADRREFLWTHLNTEPDLWRRACGVDVFSRALRRAYRLALRMLTN